MSGHDESPKKSSGITAACVLIAAYLIFALVSFTFVSTFGPVAVFEFPQVIIILGINYLSLVVFPLAGWRMLREKASFLGLSGAHFKKSLPAGIAAFFLAGIWQFCLPRPDSIGIVPDRPLFLLVAFIPILALLLPLLDMKYAPKIHMPIGLITLAAWALQAYLFPAGDEELMNSLKDASANYFDLAVLTFLIGIYVPFVEEFFFRGFVLNVFLKRNQPYFSIFLTAFLFGFAHYGSPGMVSLALLAVPLGMLSYFNDSIYPAVWAHAGLNLSAMAMLWLSIN